jgi:flagellar hook-associated protein 1 FlgK
MSDIYGILNIGGNALLTQQKAITVTGNNIANVNTPGYSRQRLELEAVAGLQTPAGSLGAGVRQRGVERMYDRFLGVQINTETAGLGKWEAHQQALERVETIFNESDEYGLNHALSEFWQGWQTLGLQPAGETERRVLSVRGQALADIFQKTYGDLQQARADIDASIQGTVETVNRMTRDIADLNLKIARAETSGQSANAYRDSRDLALKELAAEIEISSFEDAQGQVVVSTGQGRTLVESGHSYELAVETNTDGYTDIIWPKVDGSLVNITREIDGGKMGGWLTARDVDIQGYMDRLDTLAQTLMERVNAVHQTGFGLDGSTGNQFFILAGGPPAMGIEINPDILDHPGIIAAAMELGSVPGDNGNALEIAGLQHELSMSGASATFNDYYSALVSDVGHDVGQATAYRTHQSDMVAHLENYRESVSGVNIDEEMINLVKFQAAYDASAKLISTADELLQTILGMI